MPSAATGRQVLPAAADSGRPVDGIAMEATLGTDSVACQAAALLGKQQGGHVPIS
jgi:hypothetical protein